MTMANYGRGNDLSLAALANGNDWPLENVNATLKQWPSDVRHVPVVRVLFP